MLVDKLNLYIYTDYNVLSEIHMQKRLRDYIIYKLLIYRIIGE